MLPDGSIDLWISRPPRDLDPRVRQRYLEWLSDEEIRRWRVQHTVSLRRQYLVAHALRRFAVAAALNRSPSHLSFSRSSRGRPILSNGEDAAEISFSLARTSGLVVCGVARTTVGVDIEHLERDVDERRLAHRFFADTEAEALEDLPPAEQSRRFFALWTLKEAYVKATGEGISNRPFDQCPITIEGDRLRLAKESSSQWWRLLVLEPSPHHMAALVCRAHNRGTTVVRARAVLPLVTEPVTADLSARARSDSIVVA